MFVLRSFFKQPAIISSAIATVLLFGIQRLGMLEPIELKVFDQMIQIRGNLVRDPRILVVAVTEKDLQKLQKWPLSGEILDNLFTKLEQYQPRVIGLDIFRDLRVEPGHDKLLQHIQKSDRIISVCQHSDSANPPISPPAGTQPEQVGFSDVVGDKDDIIRRNLLLIKPESTSPCATPYSFGLQVALHYLGNIQAKFSANKELQIGNTIFKRLQNDSGGYQKVDAGGYQILLNYRSANPVKQVTVSEVLANQINPALIKDKIVLIGSSAPSLKDIFNTPYSANLQDNQKMPGVVLQAQMVSQILSAVVNKQPLFWFFPEWGEVVWIWVWSLAGGFIAWRIQHPLRLTLASGVIIVLLLGTNYIIFTQAGWIPVVSPTLGLLVATASVVAYNAFCYKREQEKIARQIQEQERTIKLLQALLQEDGNTDNETIAIPRFQKDALLNQRYKVIEPLGSGGFGKTYLAEDTQRPGNPQCVVKHLQPARQDKEFLDVARRLFKTEGEILELLGKSDRIPQLLAYFEENQQFYLVQQFIPGHSLSEEIKSGKRLSEAKVLELLQDVLQVLVFVHSHHVIHRDIKPANLIRRQQDNRLVLIDFGAVKQIQSQQIEDNQSIAIGTAGYAPPEQLLGHPRLNSDLYALGMIGIEALTGIPGRQFQRNPHGELVFKSDSHTDAVIWYKLDNINEKLATILDKMVAYDFIQRYQSASEVLQSLEKVLLPLM
ncbi:CHASE2 domain-containing serine/threonine-protein kinase [Tolypothrix sp. NIES-4075]|uniref:CHASE2 domain-containing serine/threonine-protein kinase n=1 Tax=Tolypothrix sp. NIES-4075 TaxID=2005459 RepID=UPI000B5C24B2|nr:CHASE2 domain-containing serine/threonine-protein kinase [Tolypothrix sp. NIES-4075]